MYQKPCQPQDSPEAARLWWKQWWWSVGGLHVHAPSSQVGRRARVVSGHLIHSSESGAVTCEHGGHGTTALPPRWDVEHVSQAETVIFVALGFDKMESYP